jgi:polyhydroxybutyrate depolymerase
MITFMFAIFSLHPYQGYTANIFTDIGTHQYRESIQFLYTRGIISGYSDGSFKPDQSISRAELLKIILEAGSGAIGNQNNCFTDVDNGWFTKYICYAKNQNIINGYSDGSFKPSQNITISESLKVALKTFAIEVDVSQGNNRYEPYFEFVHKNNIFSKYALRHNALMTRGQMAYLAHQLMLEKEGAISFDGQRDVASSGCGTTPPRIPPTSSVINGQVRHYITDIGDKYDKSTPIKLIFAFHGRTNPNTMVRTYYKVAQASKGNAIMVYPAWLPEEWPSRNRSNPRDKSYNLRDFALFDQLVEEFSKNYCINKDEIYVVGHSLGARFTNSLACARSDVIRAIGSVGGGTTINNCNGPTAAIIMHHPEDTLASFKSGLTARDQLLEQNSCGPETTPVGPEGGNCVEYTNCQSDAPVIRCPHSDSYEGSRYYTHTRPNFAGQAIWDFFQGLK